VFFTTASIPAEDSLILSNYNKSIWLKNKDINTYDYEV
jgi:hypothetical protein